MGHRFNDEKRMVYCVTLDSKKEHTESVEAAKAQYEAHIIFKNANIQQTSKYK